jgi:hypothetical protein
VRARAVRGRAEAHALQLVGRALVRWGSRSGAAGAAARGAPAGAEEQDAVGEADVGERGAWLGTVDTAEVAQILAQRLGQRGGRERRDVRRGHEKRHDTGRVGAGLRRLRLARGIEPEPAGWVAAARKGAAPGGRDEPPEAMTGPRLAAVGVGGGGWDLGQPAAALLWERKP